MSESIPIQAARRTEATDSSFEEVYFDVQAEIDLTKHPGGLDATEELVALCRMDATDHVLDVGCGVGMTPAYLVKEVGCRVTGLDLRGGMILRAVERAGRAGLRDRACFVVGDARHLPFRTAAFDVVMAESVLALIAEQDRALGEWVRVVKPGGAVGMTETNWRREPPADFMEHLSAGFGRMIHVHKPAGWQALLEQAGLRNVAARDHAMSLRSEFRGRLRRFGLRRLLGIWRNFFRLTWTEPKYSRFVKEALSEPLELLRYWGYGIYVGWK